MYYRFPLKNTGKITLAYKWFMIKSGTMEETVDALSEESLEECLVTLDPQSGEIPPGQEQIISVKFSPVEVVEVSYKFRCK